MGSVTQLRDEYIVTFDNSRIGRNHDVQPQTFLACDAEELAEKVWEFSRKFLLSDPRSIEVAVDLEEARGNIICGFNNGGSFTITQRLEPS